MSFATEGDAIRSRINSLWGGTTDIAWPNGSYDPTPGTAFLRVSIRNGESIQPFLGPMSQRRSTGVVFGEIMVPSNRFDDAARDLADTFAGIFRNASHDGIRYREPSAREAVIGQEEPWYRWIVEVPYYRDWEPGGTDTLTSYPYLAITSGAGFVVGDWAKAVSGTWSKAQADTAGNVSFPAVVTAVRGGTSYQVTTPGGKANIPAHGLGTAGDEVYLDQNTAGAATSTKPTSGLAQQVAVVWDADHVIVVDYPVENLS